MPQHFPKIPHGPSKHLPNPLAHCLPHHFPIACPIITQRIVACKDNVVLWYLLPALNTRNTWKNTGDDPISLLTPQIPSTLGQ